MPDLVSHDHRDLVVVELEFGQDAEIESDLAARHAKGVDLLRADQVDVPTPLRGARVAAGGERDDAFGDVAKPLQLGIVNRRQRALLAGLLQHLAVLLVGGLLDLVG